jgi:hypothetical protein
MVVATMAAAITVAGTSAGVAGIMTVFEKEDSVVKALGTAAGSMAAVTDSVVVDSMVTADFTVEATVAGFMVVAAAGMAGTDN